MGGQKELHDIMAAMQIVCHKLRPILVVNFSKILPWNAHFDEGVSVLNASKCLSMKWNGNGNGNE